MNSMNRANRETSRDSETRDAIVRDCDESASDVLVELNELDLDRVAGGCCAGKHIGN
jgi:hypothetical protein